MKKMNTKEVLLTILSFGIGLAAMGGGALFIWLMVTL